MISWRKNLQEIILQYQFNTVMYNTYGNFNTKIHFSTINALFVKYN